MSDFDISKYSEWKDEDYPTGAVIPEAGNSCQYITGGWRSARPVRDAEACTQCLICWIFCPDSSVCLKDGKVDSFDYDHCKGCGICANECPSKAIQMVPEGCEVPEAK